MSIQVNNFQGIYGRMTISQKSNSKHSENLLDKIGTFSEDHHQTMKTNREFSTYDAYTLMKNTGIECLKIKGNEGKGSWTMITDQQQLEKLQELADIYKERYPNLVKSDNVAMGFAEAEAAGQVMRTENGIMAIACNGMEYMDNTNTSRNWAINFSMNATNMYTEIMKAINDENIAGEEIEDFSKWEKYFEEKGLEYEKIIPDDEWKDETNEKGSETNTDIVVKPDGSRVLVVTMSIGGMETQMSMEISKPSNQFIDTRNKNISTEEQAAMSADDMNKNLVSDTSI